MTNRLKARDRVHVTDRNRLAGYQSGVKGTVLRVATSATAGRRYFTVAMDKDDRGLSGRSIFTEGEIEADG